MVSSKGKIEPLMGVVGLLIIVLIIWFLAMVLELK